MSSIRFNNLVKIMAVTAGVICFLVYLRALSCDFINWDDGEYVYDNPIIKNLNKDLFITSFTSSPLNFWIPLTWISFALDYHFWGLKPFGYHLTNIVLHSINTGTMLLVANKLWIQWRRSNGNNSTQPVDGQKHLYLLMLLFTALVWAIHPARVESVVWITERKDVLNGLFTLSSILFYLRHVQSVETEDGEKKWCSDYVISLFLFLFSLMSKPTSVMLPVMLFVIDWYPLGRLSKGKIVPVMLEKVPYLLLSAAVGVITIILNEKIDAYIPVDFFPLKERVVVIGNSLFEYFRYMINPLGILPYHHLPMHIPQFFIYKTIVAVAVIVCCFWIGKKKRWLSAVLISFIVPLLPVLQFFPNGYQPALCLRYTYLPSLFPCIILSGILFAWMQSFDNKYNKKAACIVLLFLLLFYVAVTENHISDWKNSGTFWSKTIEHQPFDRAYYYRALYYADSEKNYPAAIDDFTTSLKMHEDDHSPEVFNLYAFRGEALGRAGRYLEAVKDFDVAISIFPHKLYFYYRGYALKELGRIQEAERDIAFAGNTVGRMRWIKLGSPLE